MISITHIFVFCSVFSVFSENVSAFPWSPLKIFARQGDINQNVNQNNIIISNTATNNSICVHGERRCSNGAGGYNSSDICNWNAWIRYKCPTGLRCVDNDWTCAFPEQADWISTIYQANPSNNADSCPFGLSDHGCSPNPRPVMAYNSSAQAVAAVTVATQITYDLTQVFPTATVTQTTTTTTTSSAACPTKTVVVQQPCKHGAKKCTEKGVYTCVYGVWQGCLCSSDAICVPHFYECLPFTRFVDSILQIRQEIQSTVYENNAVIPWFQGFDAGPSIININQNTNINDIDIDIVITAPIVVPTSTVTTTTTATQTNNQTITATWSTTQTQNWTETETWSTTTTTTETLTVTSTTANVTEIDQSTIITESSTSSDTSTETTSETSTTVSSETTSESTLVPAESTPVPTESTPVPVESTPVPAESTPETIEPTLTESLPTSESTANVTVTIFV